MPITTSLLALVYLLCLTWIIYDISEHNKYLKTERKKMWIAFAVLLSPVTAIAYYCIDKKPSRDWH